MKGIQEMGEVIKNSMFKKEKRSHKFLLAPMTAITYQEYICCGCCKNGKQIRLDDKIEDIVRAEATIAEAMEHLVPIVEKGRPTRMEESVCCQCCCEKNANPGYDFLFNRQKFRSLLIIQLTMFFMAIILLKTAINILNSGRESGRLPDSTDLGPDSPMTVFALERRLENDPTEKNCGAL